MTATLDLTPEELRTIESALTAKAAEALQLAARADDAGVRRLAKKRADDTIALIRRVRAARGL